MLTASDKKHLKLMLQFVKEGGILARKFIHRSEPSHKKDNSSISRADKAISQLAHKMLKPLLKSSEHLLIDEEDPNKNNYLNQEFIKSKKYIWAVDPIDGTRLYVNKIPTYGISIGLLKDGKPHLGVVYFPSMDELFYCDGKKAYFVADAFSSKEKRTTIKSIDQTISHHSVFFCHDTIFRTFDWDYSDCHVMIEACAIVDLCWPSIGRGCGSVVRSSIWDYAGSWPIARAAGLELRHLDTGRILSSIHVDDFETVRSPWKLKDYYILSSKKNFPILKNKLIRRK